jgi:hypothetical protein
MMEKATILPKIQEKPKLAPATLDNSWKIFESTGSVEAFLKFVRASSQEEAFLSRD